jgi:hypothetical protein
MSYKEDMSPTLIILDSSRRGKFIIMFSSLAGDMGMVGDDQNAWVGHHY